jgi:hypothetical protein
MTDLQSTLTDRGKRYGDFASHAQITMDIKRVIHASCADRNQILCDDQMEALHMIAHKIGRIINGDPDYADSWHDIAGYAQLVANRLNND